MSLNIPQISTPIASFWDRNAITLKLLTIAILCLILLIPSSMIESLVHEREANMQKAQHEVSAMWGSPQLIGGPILNIPYTTELKDNTGAALIEKHVAHFLPVELNIYSEVLPEQRKRGIYELILYRSHNKIEGKFEQPNFKALHISPAQVHWDEAYITVGLSDLKGISDTIQFSWDQKNKNVSPGTGTQGVFQSGFLVNLEMLEDISHTFNFQVNINGNSELRFIPLGKETKVTMGSSWKNPSFVGSFLPVDRTISQVGFEANWKVLELNRNFPQQWSDNEYQFSSEILPEQNFLVEEKLENNYSKISSFGVSLLKPVDMYHKTIRSIKYAFLFIALTFVVFFFIEVFNKIRVHPIHYLLIGIALVIFYSLLLSLTEHFDFNLAYLIASIAIVALISFYSKAVLKSTNFMIIILLMLSVLYTFLFTLLQLQDYALLIGNIGLFIILAIIMYFSRKIDWYAIRGITK